MQGKIGYADTATDPAPMTMIETTIQLERDRSNRGRCESRFAFAGTRPITPKSSPTATNSRRSAGAGDQRCPGDTWSVRLLTRSAMPIRTRLDMLRTVFAPVGLSSWATIWRSQLIAEGSGVSCKPTDLAKRIRDISTEAINGGRYVDIRDRAAGPLADAKVQGAIGIPPRSVGMTVEGRSRYQISCVSEIARQRRPLGDVLAPTAQGGNFGRSG